MYVRSTNEREQLTSIFIIHFIIIIN